MQLKSTQKFIQNRNYEKINCFKKITQKNLLKRNYAKTMQKKLQNNVIIQNKLQKKIIQKRNYTKIYKNKLYIKHAKNYTTK